ncbi:SpoIIE family protein phosphatase [Nocardioides ferulae]|uniref:SpoIIE family protein phosphatase n=1 Tax=Nocardioides ferulae TaxID=2340821 RepID=UPI0013DD9BEB|nr:SpoIIE family protein phosphatase [Nocardioides ferulae]
MTRRALAAPVAVVFLPDDPLPLAAAAGLPDSWQRVVGDPVRSPCRYVVDDQRPVVLADAREDGRLQRHPAVAEHGIAAYAGWPLSDATGTVVGALAAFDPEPRNWDERELEDLEDLAAACSAELARRTLEREAAERRRLVDDVSHRAQVLLALSDGLSATRDLTEIATAVERIALDQLGCLRAGLWLRSTPGSAGRVADLPAAPDGGTESLRLVWAPGRSGPNDRDWRQPADGSNPVGDALSRNRPLFLRSRRERDERYPHLRDPEPTGQARCYMPLSVRGQAQGTLALLWDDHRELSDEDRVTIAALTSYTAQAVQRAQLFQERLDALVTLQRSMLPRLPEPDDLELAARYRTAAERDQVGGDWYDAVTMPHPLGGAGSTAVMIGDVVGHDMAAAATMGQLRTMLRAFAWALDDAPSENVTRLDRAMRELGVDGLASLFYARIEDPRPGGERVLRWTNAGHPPPVLVEPDGTAVLLREGPGDLLVGVNPETPRSDNRTAIRPGSTLLLYTDGLVERRGEDITVGLDRLAASASRHHGAATVADLLDLVLDDLLGDRLDDDVAVLGVRFR